MKSTFQKGSLEKPLHREKLVDPKKGKTIVETSKRLDLEGAGEELLRDTMKGGEVGSSMEKEQDAPTQQG